MDDSLLPKVDTAPDVLKCVWKIQNTKNASKPVFCNKWLHNHCVEIDKKSGHFNYFPPVWPLNDLGVTLTWPWCYVYDSEQSRRE